VGEGAIAPAPAIISVMPTRAATAASGPPTDRDLAPTEFIDTAHPAVIRFVGRTRDGAADDAQIARRLFAGVRDEIRYDPYRMPTDRHAYRASAVLEAGRSFCVPKAVLLTAAARATGIPSRLGFADVRNHLQSDRLREQMGTDLFVYHGYSVLFIGGRWLKASPAFNAELCARFGVPPLDFDGESDALLHAFSGDGSRYMEYLTDHGTFDDLPLEELLEDYRRAYPALTFTG
jgi:transglutaminase-like putative cysteine protease